VDTRWNRGTLNFSLPHAYRSIILFSCHLGNSIIYDTVSEFHWGVDLRNHPIKVIIEQLLQADWGPAVLLGREVPVLTEEDAECQVGSWISP
jgi:lipase ATG15